MNDKRPIEEIIASRDEARRELREQLIRMNMWTEENEKEYNLNK